MESAKGSPGGTNPPLEATAAGRPPGAEFERLLNLLWQEHEQLRRECARLHGEGPRQPAGEDLHAAAADPPGLERPSAGDAGQSAGEGSATRLAVAANDAGEPAGEGRAPDVAAPSSEEQAADVDRSGSDPRGSAPRLKMLKSFRNNFRLSPPPFKEVLKQSQLDDDIGNSSANRKLVADVIAKYRARKRTVVYFPFSGAKEIKDRLRWVRTKKFSYVFSCIIILNAIYIGFETETSIRDISEEGEYTESHHLGLWLAGDFVFAIIFLIEIVLRIFAYQRKFFTGTPWRWNAFDCLICLATLVAAMYDSLRFPSNFWISLSKILRLARLVRALRTSRSPLFHTLKTLTYTVAGSCNAFASAILLLFVVMFSFGTMFMQGLNAHLLKNDLDADVKEDLLSDFGSTRRTLVTLSACITGGRDWVEVFDPLVAFGGEFQLFFLVYIMFTLVGVLNILNGVFVNAAIESATKIKELAVENTHHKTVAMVEQLVRCWMEMDKGLAGKVSWADMRDLMGHDEVREFLLANDIDVSSAREIFILLDKDSTGELHPEEFVDNLISLQGNAKAIDMASLRVVCDEMSERIYEMERTILPNSPGLGWLTHQAVGGRGRARDRRVIPSRVRSFERSGSQTGDFDAA